MKVILRIIFGILGGVVMTSCVSTVSEPETSHTPIQFGTSVSRAAVNTADDLSSFSVWGGYENVSLFDGTEVSKTSDGWTYEGGTRYWVPGKTFNFYAVHPSGKATSEDSGQTLKVSDFQCPRSFEELSEVTDLMTAYNSVTATVNQGPVDLMFKHALTRVNLAVKLADDIPAGYKVDILFLNFGAFTKGNMTLSLNTQSPIPEWNVDNTSFQVFSFSGTDGTLVNHTDITASGGQNVSVDITPEEYDMYFIPQTILEKGQNMKIRYVLKNDKPETDPGYRYIENEIEIPLYNASITKWNPGDYITYTVTISRYNVTVVLNVGDWEDGNYGNENIDFE